MTCSQTNLAQPSRTTLRGARPAILPWNPLAAHKQAHQQAAKHAASPANYPDPQTNTAKPLQPAAMLYLRPSGGTQSVLQFQTFDAAYIESLRAGDTRTQEHFVSYFTALINLKLRSRLSSPQAVEDVRQETFARVLRVLRKADGLRQPERLGPFVNTVCNNVLLEHYRQSTRSDSLDEEGMPEPHDHRATSLDLAESQQTEVHVRAILQDLPPHDRSLLKAIFLEERDRDEVCREFGVDRDYLRVLLHRAKKVFKVAYISRLGDPLPITRVGQA